MRFPGGCDDDGIYLFICDNVFVIGRYKRCRLTGSFYDFCTFLCTVFVTVADSNNLFFLGQNDIFQQIFSTASKADVSDFNVFHQSFSFMCLF